MTIGTRMGPTERAVVDALQNVEYRVDKGSPHPLGATIQSAGVNFSVYSEHATGVELLLFAAPGAVQPFQVIPLDPRVHRTYHFWHCLVRDLQEGTLYAYRVSGPDDVSASGHRFSHNKVLIDPYSRGNSDHLWSRGDACGPQDNLQTSMRSTVIDTGAYDWEGDQPLRRPINETIIYELHVGGFTRSPSAAVEHPGKFRGLIEKIPYLQQLGVTAVELLPVFEFDSRTTLREVDGKPLRNYWGYSTIGYFSPESSYCVSPATSSHLDDFRDMVKALHRAGIEVILDVVYNHTDEGNHLGPVFSLKGFENSAYYFLVPWDKRYYMDYTGCGNTLNCNHPIANKLILESLEFWVREMHVDGFRFDEGSVLSRGEDGVPMTNPPVIWNIELSEILADTKIIAEAWDAAGLYQIGYYPGWRWAEWNGRYRDDIRRFVKGEPGLIGVVASRIAGSADLYQPHGHQPINSVNFVTAHDGFTLNDLVSYTWKHNELNGEGNRDGVDENLSWNCGIEGQTSDPAVEQLRNRQIRNFVAILLLSQGIPMFVMGDEVRRSQGGNNNAYCQDNETAWFDWELVDKNRDLLRFVSQMIAFRCRHSGLRRASFFTVEKNERGLADISWHGCALNSPGWRDPQAHALAFTMGGFEGDADLHVMMNMYWEPLEFELPRVPGRRWHRAVDTSLAAPGDIVEPGRELEISAECYRVNDRSVVVLISR